MRKGHVEQNDAIEAAYRRGYHHGLFQGMELIFGLLESGIPKSAVADLCQVFLQQAIIPWRSAEAEGSSAAPHFDLETSQRFLRESKEHNARD